MSDPLEELGQFFDMMYGDQIGFAYSPTKDPDTTDWKRYFFEWPLQKEELVAHCLEEMGTKEVYYSPALFSRAAAEKEDFLGSYFVWCDFDGNAPVDIAGVPEPTIKIQSSEQSNQHWYWKLDHFEKDISVVETISQRITYQSKGDLGHWNGNAVLRPPMTMHHESARIVSVIRWTDDTSPVSDFGTLPELPITSELVTDGELGRIPEAIEVVAKYPWAREDWLLFILKELPTKEGKPPGVGYRNEILAKLGHVCIEMGMSNAEAFAILLHADNRWGKFKGQRRQKKQLISILNYCRTRHPIAPIEDEVDSPFRVFSWDEFKNHEIKIDWVVKDLVHKKGIVVIAGPPGAGKSQLSLRFMEAMAKGRNFLKWQIDKPRKMLFVSLEMPHEEVKYFLDIMNMEETDEHRENFNILPYGASMSLLDVANQGQLIDKINEFQPEGIIIDSLGTALGKNLNGDEEILKLFHFIKFQIIRNFGCFVWFVHHPRKGQIGNKVPDKLDDLYGNTYIAGQATTVMMLNDKGGILELSNPKLRMAAEFKTLKLRRTPDLNFNMFEGLAMSQSTGDTTVESIQKSPLFGGSSSELGDSI